MTTAIPDAAPAPTVAPTTTRAAAAGALPGEPVEVSFTSSDGQALSGLHYPSAEVGAPLVVLFHSEMGDASEWHAMAPWLQNRGLRNQFPLTSHIPLVDGGWYADMPAAPTYNVFIASVRGCSPHPDGCPNWTPDLWLEDAQAALTTAAALPTVDPDRIVTLGAGMGADAAADTCAWWNTDHPGACDGTFTVNPGSYLGITYGEDVAELGAMEPTVPVWCVALSPTMLGLCQGADETDNSAYTTVGIKDTGSGKEVFTPLAIPDPMQTIIDFLAATVPMA